MPPVRIRGSARPAYSQVSYLYPVLEPHKPPARGMLNGSGRQRHAERVAPPGLMTGMEQPDEQGSSDHGTLRDAVTVTRAAHPSDAALDPFLAERGVDLLRAAVLLTGSMQAGEDLVQAALEQVLPRWRTIDGDLGAQVRRAVYHLAAHGRRRRPTRLPKPATGPALRLVVRETT
jgi:hypothetical protein